ncbi:MAG: transrane protein [Bacteroidota bacterium]|jgi:hypothetical protein
MTRFKLLIIAAFLLLPFCLISDWLIHQHYFFKQEYWGVYDNWVHGIIAVLIAFPLFVSEKFGEPLRFAKLVQNAVVVFLIASLLDLDHFAVNFSFSLTKAISLPMRPITHSLLFATLMSAAFFFITKNKKWTWLIFAAIVSHVVRDAYGGGTPIFYPAKISMIPYWSYLVSEYLLIISSFLISKIINNEKRQRQFF